MKVIKPDFSMIVPIYNIEEALLCECIQSLQNQTLHDIEIILVDDGSTNNSLEICNDYARKDTRIKVISQENQGVSVARNIGINNSLSEWIVFIDPDDWVELNMCEELKNGIMRYNPDILMCTHYINTLNNKEALLYGDKNDFLFNKSEHELLQQSILFYEDAYAPIELGSVWAKAYRKQMLINSKITFSDKLPRAQDRIFNLYAIEVSEKIAFINKPLYHYRTVETSACRKLNLNNYKLLGYTTDAAYDFSQKFNRLEKFQLAIDTYTLINLALVVNNDIFHTDNRRNYFAKKKVYLDILQSSPYKESLGRINLQLVRKRTNKFKFILFKHKLFFPFFIYEKWKK